MRDRNANVDVMVIIDHPHGKIEMPLEEWIAKGPGERALLRPVAAKSRKTGRILSTSVIPLRYRNSILSRALIASKLLPDPWKQA